MITSKVYVVQESLTRRGKDPKYDLSPAKAFGTLVYLFEWSELRDFDAKVMIRKLRERLTDFSDDDYLLLIGNPMAIGSAIAIAAESNLGLVKVLYWTNGAYEVHEMEFGSNYLASGHPKRPILEKDAV